MTKIKQTAILLAIIVLGIGGIVLITMTFTAETTLSYLVYAYTGMLMVTISLIITSTSDAIAWFDRYLTDVLSNDVKSPEIKGTNTYEYRTEAELVQDLDKEIASKMYIIDGLDKEIRSKRVSVKYLSETYAAYLNDKEFMSYVNGKVKKR